MIAVAGTTQSLELKLAGAAATTELPITAAFVAISQTTLALVGGTSFAGITTGATPVVLSAAPGANIENRLNALTVVNVDTAAATVTLQVDVSGTKRIALRIILSVGDSLVVTYTSIDILDSAGNKKQTVGLSAYGDPVTVAHGGTGLATLTSRGVLVGQGTGNVVPTAAGAVNTVLHGAGAGADPTFTTVVEADQTLSDVTTRDVSTTMHGYVPKAPNNTGQFLRADAAYGYPGERTSSTASSATPTPNADTDDRYEVSALAAAAAFGAPTGTPRNGQRLRILIKDNGTARALTWNAAYVAGGVALPTTTVISKLLEVGFEYSTMNALNKWRCIASAQEA